MQLMKAALISSTVFMVMALPAHAAESSKKKGYGDNPNIFEVLGQKTLDTAQDAANAVDRTTQEGIAKVRPKVAETWETLSEQEQRALIKRYQSLKEIPDEQSDSLQQRMDWFTQLPEQDKQKMRETWQKMSTQERRELGQRLQRATPEERPLIRQEYILKYQQPAMSH